MTQIGQKDLSTKNPSQFRILPVLFPVLRIDKKRWRLLWEKSERQSFIFGARIFFSLLILAYPLHFLLVDLALDKKPISIWAIYRFGITTMLAIGLILTFRKPIFIKRYYRFPLMLCGIVIVAMQAQTTIWRAEVSYFYTIFLATISSVAIRKSVLESLAYLSVTYLFCLRAWALRPAEIPYVISSVVVSYAVVAIIQSRLSKDINAFIATQNQLETQRKLIASQKKLAKEESEKSARHRAIASLTQMLAHDVRRPFSMVKIGIDQIMAHNNDPVAARSWALKTREQVSRALEQVNGMIQDIMEVSNSTALLHQKSYSLKELIAAMLSQAFRYENDCHINFEYNFSHASQVHVDYLKIQRVFANILDNAHQAMKGRGCIWIYTKEIYENHLVEITIGNSNSFIQEHDLANIFDAFFTKDKQDGTGLGLAIAKKIVSEHGGSIYCKSSLGKGTEFVLTLPVASDTDDQNDVSLPSSSQVVRADFIVSLNPNG